MNKGKTKHTLTNEYLTKNFADNFTLALSAIDIGRHLIKSGKEVTVTSLLEQIAKSPTPEPEIVA